MTAHVDPVRDTFADRVGEAATLMGEAKDEVFAFSSFLRAHWRQIWSTNLLQHLNVELERRWRVVGIVPGEIALVRLADAVIIDMHEERIAAERRYCSEASMAELDPWRDDGDGRSAEPESGA